MKLKFFVGVVSCLTFQAIDVPVVLAQAGWCNVLEDAPCDEFFGYEEQCFGEDCDVEIDYNPFSGDPFVVSAECPDGISDTETTDNTISVVREAWEGESGNTYYGAGSNPQFVSCTQTRPCDSECWEFDDYAICRSDYDLPFSGNNDSWQPIALGNGCSVSYEDYE